MPTSIPISKTLHKRLMRYLGSPWTKCPQDDEAKKLYLFLFRAKRRYEDSADAAANRLFLRRKAETKKAFIGTNTKQFETTSPVTRLCHFCHRMTSRLVRFGAMTYSLPCCRGCQK